MSLYIGSTVVNVTDMKKGIAFWTEALGYKVRSEDDTFAVLTDPDRSWSNLSLQLTDKPKQDLNRLHLDLYTNQQQAEVARLEELGANCIPWTYPPDADFVVMTDPDGNEFCVIQTGQTQP
jgi:catechol 2,3-dioxygenase-like lactoylglutathione lyase family enzyme